MDYQSEIDRIIDALHADPNRPPKWRNKAIARLEEAQVFAMVEEDTGTWPEPGSNTTIEHPGQPGTNTLTVDEIPEELRTVADPKQIKPLDLP